MGKRLGIDSEINRTIRAACHDSGIAVALFEWSEVGVLKLWLSIDRQVAIRLAEGDTYSQILQALREADR